MDTPETWITPLTPLSFLRRSAAVYPDKVAIVHGTARHTYADFARDAQRLARGLRASGVGPGDRVACLLPNVPEMLVAHFGVPLGRAVLVAVNTRLSSEEVRYILDHSGATVLVVEIRDPREDELPDVGDLTLVDAETGREVRVDTSSARLRARFAEAAVRDREHVAHELRRLRVRHVVLSTSGSWLRSLADQLRLQGMLP